MCQSIISPSTSTFSVKYMAFFLDDIKPVHEIGIMALVGNPKYHNAIMKTVGALVFGNPSHDAKGWSFEENSKALGSI